MLEIIVTLTQPPLETAQSPFNRALEHSRWGLEARRAESSWDRLFATAIRRATIVAGRTPRMFSAKENLPVTLELPGATIR